MHETADDIEALQQLLDSSYATAGAHLLSSITPERRVAATELVRRLEGMTLLTLATVHGRAVPIDVRAGEEAGFRRTLLEIYVPRYGAQWETEFLESGPVYCRIEADRMFTFHTCPER